MRSLTALKAHRPIPWLVKSVKKAYTRGTRSHWTASDDEHARKRLNLAKFTLDMSTLSTVAVVTFDVTDEWVTSRSVKPRNVRRACNKRGRRILPVGTTLIVGCNAMRNCKKRKIEVLFY